MSIMRVYYARPMGFYNTVQDMEVKDHLRRHFPDAAIVDPGSPAVCLEARNHQGMSFFGGLVFSCDALAFLTFDDGCLGAGVAYEIDAAHRIGRPVHHIAGPHLILADRRYVADIRRLSIEETARCNRLMQNSTRAA